MFEQPYKRSHESPIPKITLLNLLETSNKLSSVKNTFDKVSPKRSFSPNFSRIWTIIPKKAPKRTRNNRLKPINLAYHSQNSSKIDNYLSKVLEEFQIKDVNFNEKNPSLKQKDKKNVFDKFFGENGDEEEKKLLKYVRTCDTSDLY